MLIELNFHWTRLVFLNSAKIVYLKPVFRIDIITLRLLLKIKLLFK